jgi:hypothetical protein
MSEINPQAPGQNNLANHALESDDLGIYFGPLPTISRALSLLYDAAADNLTRDQLHYLAQFSDMAQEQAANLSSVLSDISTLYGYVNAGYEPDEQGTALLLDNLSKQLDGISGLIKLSSAASCRLAKPKAEANRQKRQA